MKAGATKTTAGVKIGSYWPGNTARGILGHRSTVILLDQDTSRADAIVEASSRTLGEFQHAPDDPTHPTGRSPARTIPRPVGDTQITVFDSSGFAVQDLTLAAALLAAENSHTLGPTP